MARIIYKINSCSLWKSGIHYRGWSSSSYSGAAGYRLTNQRRVIVRELEGARHLSAEEIYDRVKGEYPEIGLSTVYRTLDLLHELGIVRKEDFGEGYSRYELSTERMHHHARCRECGAVIEFNEELMEYLALQVERETGFVTEWHEITLHGRCAACAAP
jgi:Fur family ferric uptake transcriptional regulator